MCVCVVAKTISPTHKIRKHSASTILATINAPSTMAWSQHTYQYTTTIVSQSVYLEPMDDDNILLCIAS